MSTARRRLVVLGGPGDGLVVAEAIHQAAAAGQAIELVGFLNDALPSGSVLQNVPVLGRFEDWRLLDSDMLFCPAVQKVKDMPARVDRIESLGIPDERWGTIIHPRAVVASDVEVGVGAFVASCVTVQPGSRIGRFASVRAGAVLGHHSVVDDHGYVGPNATMCGRTVVSYGAHLGPGRSARQPHSRTILRRGNFGGGYQGRARVLGCVRKSCRPGWYGSKTSEIKSYPTSGMLESRKHGRSR